MALKAAIVLKDEDRQKLDGIVSQMTSNKESDETIQLLVDDFKSKYGIKKKEENGILSKNGTENISPSTSPLTSEEVANNVFSFDKFRTKKSPLPANIKQASQDVESVLQDINIGATTPKKLSELYNNANGKDLVKSIINEYAPQFGQIGWDNDIYGNEKKWATLSKNINASNRVNALDAEANSVKELDSKINQFSQPYRTYSRVEDAVVPKDQPMVPNIDLTNDKEISNAIEDLKQRDFSSVGEHGHISEESAIEQIKIQKGLEAKRDAAIGLLKQRLFFNKTNQEIDPEIKELSPRIKNAVTSVNMARERGEDIKVEEYADHDNMNADHFEIGLNYIKDENPGKYENIIRAIEKKGKIADTDFRDVSRIGQDIKNQQVFRAAAHNPELIDAETDLDYTTYQDKKSIAAGAIGEWLKENGYKNFRQFTPKIIKQAALATGVTNKDIVNDLVEEEGILGYDAIPKSGWREAIARGVMQPFAGIESTFHDIKNDDATNYLRTQQYDVGIGGQKVPGKKGELSTRLASEKSNLWYDALEGFGQFIPQILLTKGIGGASAGVLGADARIALSAAQKANISTYGGTFISTYLQEYGNAYEQALQTTGDPKTAKAMGAINGTAAALFEEILPDTKIADKAADLFRKGGFADDIIDLLKKGGNPAELSRKGRPIIEKFVNQTLNTTSQEVKEEVGTQLVNYITEGIFSPKTAKDRDVARELFDTAKATAVSMILPAVFGGAGAATNKNFTVNGLHSAAINFEDYKSSLNKALIDDRITQDEYDAGIKMLSTHRQSIAESPSQSSEGKKLSTSEKLEYAYQETLLKKYNNDIKQTASEVAKEDIQNKINKSQEIQRQILDLPKPELKEGEKPVKVDKEWKQRTIPFEEESVIEPEPEPNNLTPEETIVEAANKGNLEGIYGDMVKADPSKANAVILDLAKQKYGIQEDGSEHPDGGRDISMKTSLDVDEAVTKVFPNKQSVINQILKPQENVENQNNAEASKETEGVLNQEGAAKTQETEAAPISAKEESPFKESKVPHVVYRASTGGKFGEGKAIHFTSNEKYAESYAYDMKGNKVGEVSASYVDLKNPLEISMQKDYVALANGKLIEKAKAEGYDGIIAKDETGDNIDEIVVFDKSQIVSANKPAKKTESEAKSKVSAEQIKKELNKKTSDKLRSLSQKIRDKGLHEALPSWAKADLPEGTKSASFGGKYLDAAIAKAIDIVADAIDAGVSMGEAINQGFIDLKKYYKENTKSFDEVKLRKDFEVFFKDVDQKIVSSIPSVDLTTIKKDADAIFAGKAVFERFSQKEHRGLLEGGRANVEASLLLGANEGAGQENISASSSQESQVEQYAKDNGIWIDDTTEFLNEKYGNQIGQGAEAIVWGDPKRGKVVKTQNTLQYGNLQQKLDGITLHNSYFQEAPLKVIGFGRDSGGEFQVIVEQPFIQGDKVSLEEIKKYLSGIGLTDQDGHHFNNDVIVDDIHTGNAIKRSNDRVIVIDPIMRLNTPEQGYGGERVINNKITYLAASEEKEEKPKIRVVGKEDKEKEGDIIDDYEMKTSGEVSKMLSGETLEDVFGQTPEGEQDYEVQRLNDMLNDGRNMIQMAQGRWGNDIMDYGKSLFGYVQKMSNDKQLTNKKAVLLATFLGELKESIIREPERKGEIQPLYNLVESYYQQYMNKVGKELAAGRLLRLYRDKYLADVFSDRILEEEQVRAKRKLQDVELKKKIDDETATEDKAITQQQKDDQDKADKAKSKKVKTDQSKKKKLSTDEAKKKAEAKLEEIKNSSGDKKGLIDKINEAIKRLNCK